MYSTMEQKQKLPHRYIRLHFQKEKEEEKKNAFRSISSACVLDFTWKKKANKQRQHP